MNTDLTPLTPGEEAPDTKKKNIVPAYEIAAEGHDLEHFKNMLREHQKDEENGEKQTVRAAAKEAKPAKGDRKKRKSADVADADEGEEVDESDADKRKAAKKRKKDAESDAESEKVCRLCSA